MPKNNAGDTAASAAGNTAASTGTVKNSKKKYTDSDVKEMYYKLMEKVTGYGNEKAGEKRFKYNLDKPSVYFDYFEKILKLKDRIKNRWGYTVEVCEYIEEFDVMNKNKFFISIEDWNGNKAEYDMFEYKRIVNDYSESEYELIAQTLEKMNGNREMEDFDWMVEDIVHYLSYACYFKEEQVKVYKTLGWAKYNSRNIFKYDVIYNNFLGEMKGKCISGIKEAITPSGPSDEEWENMFSWVKTAIELMNYSVVACLAVGAGVSGVLRQLMTPTKERNINMNIVGAPGTGKTTLTNFVLSIFGNPGELEGNFSDTENAVELLRAERAVIPYVIDDRMLRMEGMSEASQSRELLMSIFREYEGRVKERAGGQRNESSGQRTWSPVMSSSVKPMLDTLFYNGIDDYGQYRRFIEINIRSADLFKDSAHAEQVNEVSVSTYGYGIKMLVEFLMEKEYNDGVKLDELFDKTNVDMRKSIDNREKKENIKGMQSSSQRFSLIVFSYDMFRKALIRYFKDMGKVPEKKTEIAIKDRSSEVRDLLIDNLVEKIRRVKQNSAIKIADNICKFVDKHRKLFFEGNKKWGWESDCIGKLEEDDGRYIITVRKTANIGWLMVSPDDFDEKEIKEYLEVLKAGEFEKDNVKIKRCFSNLAGGQKKGDFEEYIKKYANEIAVDNVRNGSVRFMTLTVDKPKLELTGGKTDGAAEKMEGRADNEHV